jgi:chromosome segregation ATPase
VKSLKATLSLLGLISLMIWGGCDRHQEERDQARADAERAKAQVNSCRARLQRMQDEKNQLIERLADVAEQLAQANSKRALVDSTQERLEKKVGELTNQRNATAQQTGGVQDAIQQLRRQLSEKDAEIIDYQQLVQQWQAYAAELEAQLGATDQGEYAEPAEESSDETSDQEVADENST